MPTTIKLKNSVTTTNAPSSLAQGEVAINITDKKVWVGNAATTPIQLLGDGGSGNFTSLSLSGNLTFTSTGNRIIGDFTNATISNRVAFQTSTSNNTTFVSAITNGTGSTSAFDVYNGSDASNAGRGRFFVSSTSVGITADATGTGTALPLTISTGGSERIRLTTTGFFGVGTTTPASPISATLASGVSTTTGVLDLAHPGNVSFGVVALLRTYANTDNPALCISHHNGGSPVNYGIAVNSSGSLLFNQGTSPTSGVGNTRMTLTTAGALTVASTLTSGAQIINSGSASNVYTSYTNAGTGRFLVALSGTETGSNAGSNYTIANFNDAGTQIAQPFTILRSNSYIGISETSPEAALTVGSIGGTKGNIYVKQNGASNFGVGLWIAQTAGIDDPAIGINNLTAASSYGIAVNDSGGLSFRQGINPALSAGTERMVLTSAGNLGIGDTAPSQKLTVTGNVELNGQSTADQYLKIGAGRSGNGYSFIDLQGDTTYSNGLRLIRVNTGANAPSNIEHRGTGALQILTQEAGQIIFYTNGSNNRMNINASGVVQINQTSQISNERFGVTGDNVVCSLKGTNTGNVTTLRIERAATDGDGVTFFYGGTQKGYISVLSTGTGYNTLSDYRLKENIKPMTGALEKVALLKPSVYDWKGLNKSGQGFIAHELAEVVPECVVGEKDATKMESYLISPAEEATYDEDGNELTPKKEAVYGEREVPAYQGVDTSFLVATLTAAIQELNAKLEAQANEIALLKAR